MIRRYLASPRANSTVCRRCEGHRGDMRAAVAQGAEGKREVGSWEDEMEIEQIR